MDERAEVILVMVLGYLVGTVLVSAAKRFIADAAAEGLRAAGPPALKIVPEVKPA
jgi:hypothetical protein